MFKVTVLRFPSFLPLLIFTALAAGVGFFMAEVNYDWQGLIIVVAIIGILAILLVPRIAQLESGDFFFKVLACGLLLKLSFAIVRLWVTFGLYGGIADASDYHSWGITIAQHIWRLEFDQIVPFLQWGTDFIRFLTGVIYSFIGPTLYGGYLIYATLAFLGSYCFYRAFRVAFPQGNKRLYASLVFLFPSILFWPNGIGKDAVIFLCIGLSAYGSALLMQERLKGVALLVSGLLATLCIRPHIAALLALAYVLAFLVRGVGKRVYRPATFIIGLLVTGGLVWFLLPRALDFLGLYELSPETVFGFLQLQQSLTFQGGSAFQVIDILNPLAFPMAMGTLLFRPFPWEVHNLQALIQSLEGVLVMGLVLWRIKSLGKAVASLISDNYIRYILIYTITFISAFSVISNFGILARERAMLLPFFFMLIAYDRLGIRIESKPKQVMAI